MVAMDTTFVIIYCAISDVRNFVYFQLQLPKNVTDPKETYSTLKSYWWSIKYLRILTMCVQDTRCKFYIK